MYINLKKKKQTKKIKYNYQNKNSFTKFSLQLCTLSITLQRQYALPFYLVAQNIEKKTHENVLNNAARINVEEKIK